MRVYGTRVFRSREDYKRLEVSCKYFYVARDCESEGVALSEMRMEVRNSRVYLTNEQET